MKEEKPEYFDHEFDTPDPPMGWKGLIFWSATIVITVLFWFHVGKHFLRWIGL